MMTDHVTDNERCALFAGMGIGKTVTVLTALEQLILCGASEPTLVLAPLRVARSTWPDEALKWEHLRNVSVVPIVGSEIERRNALKFDVSVYTTNYENIPWLVDHFGERWPFRRVIADESTKLKSYRIKQGGARAQALGRVAYGKVKFFTELTGTPTPNGLLDLWGQMWFIDRGARLGRTYEAYKERWFRPDPGGYGGWIPLPNAQEDIEERLRDVCLTVDAADYFDVKKPFIVNKYVDLPVKARKLYKDMEKELFMQFEGHEVTAFNAGAKSQKLLQIASGAVYIDPDVDCDEQPRSKEWKEVHDVKIQALEEIVEEAAGMPVLVAYHFKSDLTRLLKAFPKGRVLDANPATIRDWNAGKIPILFAHPASAGHGLNLQDGGNILVYFSHDWNLENRQQILERIGPLRQLQSGYDRVVFVYNIIARDTLDEAVIERTEIKASVQDAFLSAMKRRN
jgi:SNF2 family DNA or RNA helicase